MADGGGQDLDAREDRVEGRREGVAGADRGRADDRDPVRRAAPLRNSAGEHVAGARPCGWCRAGRRSAAAGVKPRSVRVVTPTDPVASPAIAGSAPAATAASAEREGRQQSRPRRRGGAARGGACRHGRSAMLTRPIAGDGARRRGLRPDHALAGGDAVPAAGAALEDRGARRSRSGLAQGRDERRVALRRPGIDEEDVEAEGARALRRRRASTRSGELGPRQRVGSGRPHGVVVDRDDDEVGRRRALAGDEEAQVDEGRLDAVEGASRGRQRGAGDEDAPEGGEQGGGEGEGGLAASARAAAIRAAGAPAARRPAAAPSA